MPTVFSGRRQLRPSAIKSNRRSPFDGVDWYADGLAVGIGGYVLAPGAPPSARLPTLLPVGKDIHVAASGAPPSACLPTAADGFTVGILGYQNQKK